MNSNSSTNLRYCNYQTNIVVNITYSMFYTNLKITFCLFFFFLRVTKWFPYGKTISKDIYCLQTI